MRKPVLRVSDFVRLKQELQRIARILKFGVEQV